MTDHEALVYLPEDLEERWDHLTHAEQRALIDLWRARNADGRMTWRQRRRIRRLIGEPLTPGTGALLHAERLRDEAAERRHAARLRREYGDEGYREIATLTGKVLFNHGGMPEEKAWEWAERTYRRDAR